MLFSPFLATRYLKPKRTFVSIITVISIFGVVLGVWALTVVIAIFTGYGEQIQDSILGFEAHITVDEDGEIKDFLPVMEAVEEIDGVKSITPMVSGQVVMDFRGMRSAPVIRGVPPLEGEELERMRSNLKHDPDPSFPDEKSKAKPRGDFDLNGFSSAVISDVIANGQNVRIGDVLTLYSSKDVDSTLASIEKLRKAKTKEEREAIRRDFREATLPIEVTVTGVFDTARWESGVNLIFLNLETAQVLYGFDLEQCHKVAILTNDAFRAPGYKEKIVAALPETYRVMTWGEMNQSILAAVAMEKQSMFLILFMVVIVATFCVMNTMITVTCQKRSEIGLLKALGAKEEQVMLVLVIQGLIVGILGLTVGMAIAQWTIAERNSIGSWMGSTFGISLFTEDVQMEGGIPAKQRVSDLLIISLGSILACVTASLIPAFIASSLQPARALRNE